MTPAGKRRRRSSGGIQASYARTGYALLLPAVLVIGLVTLFPIAYSIWISFHHVRLSLQGTQYTWAGLANYVLIFHSGEFWYSLTFTVLYALSTVLIELVLGMVLALVMNYPIRGRGVAMAVMLIPWSLITVISAEMWAYIYNASYGLLNYFFVGMGLAHHPIVWLGTPNLAIMSMVIADVWKTTPFVALILLAGLQLIPPELYEAATIDGATGWVSFWKITIPLLSGSLLLSVLFRMLQAFGIFDLPFVLTGGGPGHSTTSIAIFAWKVMFRDLHFGPGSGIAVITVLVNLVLALIFIRIFGWGAIVAKEASK